MHPCSPRYTCLAAAHTTRVGASMRAHMLHPVWPPWCCSSVAQHVVFVCSACNSTDTVYVSAVCCTTPPTALAVLPRLHCTGLLVPDLPLEETTKIRAACEKVGIELVLLTTPTTPKARMADIAKLSQGFVYLVSVTGVTGVRTSVQTRVEQLVDNLHQVTDKPVAVGFGVSEPAHAKQIVEWGAEGVICGSALVRALGDAPTPEQGLKDMEQLARSLREAIPQ